MKANIIFNTNRAKKQGTHCPIAIIGMASIFPNSTNLTEYWDMILQKIDAIIDVPKSRWDVQAYYDPDPSAPDKTYCKRGGFIPDIAFDPTEFGLPPNLIEATDVTQLLSLMVAKECLEDAGYDKEGTSRENMGVILGMVGIGSKLVIPLMNRLQYPVWEKVLRSYGIAEKDIQGIVEKIKLAYPKWEENSFPGSIGNVVAGRIANRFNLGGTNCVVDAACASSLAAVRMSMSELVEGHADMMITGGVDLDNSIGSYMCFSKTPAFTKGDHVRSFDKDSGGMMVGEGIGMIMLKRLEDAKKDGDRIYAVINAIGTSSDGKYKSIYAPRPEGQALALRRAYASAGYGSTTVDLIEAHGTGTMAGDPAEFAGLREVFSENNPKKQHIALGSVKSQIGHTKAAAGVASLIKTALALHHKLLPATINVTEPHPKLNIEDSPFYINTQVRPWIKPALHPRRAGVSSFGFGGTNFHVALEEYETEKDVPYRLHTTGQIILISAENLPGLISSCQTWLKKITADKTNQTFVLLANTSITHKIPLNHPRIGFVAANREEALSKIHKALEMLSSNSNHEKLEHPAGIYYRKSALETSGKVAALFPGQGSQYLNMGSQLTINFPPLRKLFEQADRLFEADGRMPLSNVVYPIPVFTNGGREKQEKLLTQTEFAQPAIGVFSAGLYKILHQAGFTANYFAGHSYGELTALWAAGVIDDNSFVSLSLARGSAMTSPDDNSFDPGTMMAVKGDISSLENLIKEMPGVSLANWNAKNQVVIAGEKPAIAEAQAILSEKGFTLTPLSVSGAFHTQLVRHAKKPFSKALGKIRFTQPTAKVYSNTSGKEYPNEPEAIRQILAEQLLQPVRFKDEIEAMYAAGARVFVEFGSKSVLTNLVKNILEEHDDVYALSLNPSAKKDSDQQFREAVLQLCILGIDLRAFDPYKLHQKDQTQTKKSPVTVHLNGGLYLAEKTRQAFQNAISAQNHLSDHKNVQPQQSVSLSSTADFSNSSNTLYEGNRGTPEPHFVMNNNHIDHLFIRLQAMQEETSKTHSQFLSSVNEYTRLYSQLTQQELSLLSSSSPPEIAEKISHGLEVLSKGTDQLHRQQDQTIKIHEQYLQMQTALSSQLLQIAAGQPLLQASVAPFPTQSEPTLIPQPALYQRDETAETKNIGTIPAVHSYNTTAQAPVNNILAQAVQMEDVVSPLRDELVTALLNIVSEKTGYPIEMLDLNMDMEADLGIDSIKRVEILGAMQTQYPDMPKLDPAVLGEMKTLEQIVQSFTNTESGKLSDRQAEIVSNSVEPVQPSQSAYIDFPVETVQTALVEIVSEKTGYPIEMLDLNMDMESDLGIDSIKRVEILGAMQASFPEVPAPDPALIAEMRTLAQVLDLFAANQSEQPAAAISETSNAQESSEKTPTPSDQSVSESGVDAIRQALLETVSEKTGYPIEMLDLNMDMESDLGIDSIKRVEILGAMQARFPELPKADAATLAEIHTLAEIIQRLTAQKTGASESEEPRNIGKPTEQPAVVLPSALVRLKEMPLPDRLEVRRIPESVCLVTDNGTPLAAAVSSRLLENGYQPVLLKMPAALVPGERIFPEGIHSVQLKEISEEAIQKAIQSVESLFGDISMFILLDLAAGSQETFPETGKMIAKAAFLMAKHLKESLNQAAEQGLAAFMAVTRQDGQFGLAADGSNNAVSGSLNGLVKTLNLEWEKVFCRTLDLHPSFSAEEAASYILDEMHDPNRLISDISYNPDGRFTLVAAPLED